MLLLTVVNGKIVGRLRKNKNRGLGGNKVNAASSGITSENRINKGKWKNKSALNRRDVSLAPRKRNASKGGVHSM